MFLTTDAWLHNLIKYFNKIIINTWLAWSGQSTNTHYFFCWSLTHNATMMQPLLNLYFYLTVFPVFIYPTCELASLKLGSKLSTSVWSITIPSILTPSLLMSRSVNVRKLLKKERRSMKGNCKRSLSQTLLVCIMLLCHSSIHLTPLLFQFQVSPCQRLRAMTLVPWISLSFIPNLS